MTHENEYFVCTPKQEKKSEMTNTNKVEKNKIKRHSGFFRVSRK